MKTAIVTFSGQGARLAAALAARLADCEIFLHAAVAKTQADSGACVIATTHARVPQSRVDRENKGSVKPETDQENIGGSVPVHRFKRVNEVAGKLFARFRGLVFIAPAGLVVRAVAPHLRGKTTDPAVVVVDVGGRWAISLLSGHEGGANELVVAVANILDAEPIVTTTTEAAKTVIAGVGCRRGVSAERIVAAVEQSLARAGRSIDQVRLLASADLKADEAGLIEAARRLNVPLRLISSAEIRACTRDFARSPLVQKKVNLPAVAEPAALLAGRRTRLLLPRQTFTGVTVALAVESCLWSE